MWSSVQYQRPMCLKSTPTAHPGFKVEVIKRAKRLCGGVKNTTLCKPFCHPELNKYVASALWTYKMFFRMTEGKGKEKSCASVTSTIGLGKN